MFAWHEKPSPVSWPAYSMQPSPVWTATLPEADRTATCRTAASSSTRSSWASVSSGDDPPRSSFSARGP